MPIKGERIKKIAKKYKTLIREKFEIIKNYFEFNEKSRENPLLKSLKQKNIKNKKENEKERWYNFFIKTVGDIKYGL